MKILVVDDSKVIRQIVSECITTMGHDVSFAENGRQCLDYVIQHRVDLILMDIEMPVMDGLEATKGIRIHLPEDWFPIIFLTMHANDDSFAEGILAGGDAYLPKPINPLRLQLTITAMERIYLMRKRLFDAQEKLQQANEKLEQLSFYDQLTGLANRRQFDMALTQQFALSRRNKSPLSLIMCDIDCFKKYNDHYGHQQGDQCLSTVAELITAVIKRPGDLACRYGGEEFSIILPDTHLQGGRNLAEQIRLTVNDKCLPHAGSGAGQTVTLSLGIATFNGQYASTDEMIKAADDALYVAKDQGRNRVVVA